MTFYTVQAISRVLGLPESEIRRLTGENIIRQGHMGNGRYRLEETARELIDFYKGSAEQEPPADYQNERALLMRVKRKNAEHDLELRERELHTSEAVEAATALMLTRFKAKLAALPNKLTPQLVAMTDSREIFSFLRQNVDETMEELADYKAMFGD